MRYHEYLPSPELREFVNCYYVVQIGAREFVSRLIPDGCIELIFHFDCHSKRYLMDGKVEALPQMLISGPTAKSFIMKKPARTGAIGIRFFPWGAPLFLKMPASEIREQRPSQESIVGSSIRQLHDMVYSAKSHSQGIHRIDLFLKRCLKAGKPEKNREAVTAIRAIVKDRGQCKMDFLSKNYGLTQRRLEQQFMEVVGFSPKFFSRIVRLQNLLQSFNGTRSRKPLTQWALDYGYFDQSHMIHDFKFFTTQTPSEYLRDKGLNWFDFFTNPDHISSIYSLP